MNSSNEQKNYLGQAALRTAAYVVLLNAVLSGCAGSLGSIRASVAGEASIYNEIKVTRTISDPRRVRIRKRTPDEADLYDPGPAPAFVNDNTASGPRFIPAPPSQSLLTERFPPASIQPLDLPDDDANSGIQPYHGDDPAIVGANVKTGRKAR